MDARFGPAGTCDDFAAAGYKTTRQIPLFLSDLNLTAYEYQCGHGVQVNPSAAAVFAELAETADIQISLHSPYYITLSGTDEMKRLASLTYIMQSAQAIRLLGGRRIVIHSGSASKISRSTAMELAADTLRRSLDMLDEAGYDDIILCPETMGKINQLGTVEEVCELCRIDERMIPCIDFGHVNAMTAGSLKTPSDYSLLLDTIQNSLGFERLKHLHVHFSKISYTLKGGELRHLTFEDCQYGPEFEPLAEECAKRGLTPVFICESAGTQSRDANAMMRIFNAQKG